MEIKVYLSPSTYAKHNAAFSRRVEHPDVFDYNSCVSVFKSIFGVTSIIEFCVL